MISKIINVWNKYHIPPDTLLEYVLMNEKDSEGARIFLELAVRNNPLYKNQNVSQVTTDIQNILK